MTSSQSNQARDLTTLAAGAGADTGWWDDRGQPVPWPADFFDPDNDWRPDTNPTLGLDPGEQPF